MGPPPHNRAVQPETRYTVLNGLRIAYQVVGDGPPDLVMSAGSFSHTDALWEDPTAELFLRRLSSFTRLIRFDAIGTSGSDRVPRGTNRPSFAEQLDAVLAATGTGSFALLATLDAGPGALRFVADHPERVAALILYNSTARWRRGRDYPIGFDAPAAVALRAQLEAAWGTDAMAMANVPSRAHDARFRAWYAKYVRTLGTPTDLIAAVDYALAEDATGVLPHITVPTLVIHRRDWGFMPRSHGEYLAEHIPKAELVLLPGADGPAYWETPDLVLDHVERFIAGRQRESSGRRLLTLLFTDIVGSTVQAGQLGDRDWSALLAVHYGISERVAERYGGSIANRTGDGVLCVFPSPGDAVRSAVAMRDELAAMSITIRAGLHAGEVEMRHDDLSGIAVHIAARVTAEAGPGEILVSRTVRDLLVGSSARFADAGQPRLKGLDETWQLYRVDG